MHVFQDFSYALRSARQRPAFTIVLLAALALGIGLTTAIFSVFYGVLLRPLAFPSADRLVLVKERLPKVAPIAINMPAPSALEFAETPAFADAAVFIGTQRNVDGDRPERADCLRASAHLLQVLGVSPARGRNFSEQEDTARARVALVSDAFARRRFAGQDAVGKLLRLDGEQYEIVGLLPRGLVFPTHGMDQPVGTADVWIPLSLTADERAPNDNFSFSLIARMRDGVSLQQARQSAALVMNRIAGRLPPAVRAMADLHVVLLPLRDQIVGDSRRLLFLLLGAVGALLLITCMNVSNMLLSRALARRREMAVRAAIGASTRRIAWQILHENLLLFAAGGLLGVLCASWFQQIFLRLLPPDLPRTQDVHLDGVVLAFSVAVALGTGLVFGLAPAMGALRVDLTAALQEGSRAQAGGRVIGRTRQFLVAAQIGLAFVLLTSAGLLIRSFVAVLNQQSQLRTEHVLTFGVALPEREYSNVARARAFYDQLSGILARSAGVVALGYGTDLPLENARARLITAEHARTPGSPIAEYTDVAGDYFQSLGLRLLSGRPLTGADRRGAERVAVVNQAFARTYWPGDDAVDRRFKIGPPQVRTPWIRIVGVVEDSSARQPDEPVGPHIYSPLDQEEYAIGMNRAWFVLRTRGTAFDAAQAVRSAVRSLDASLPVVRMRSLEQVVEEAVAPRSANTWLVVVFAAAALLLTALGVYGVVAHSVSERTREIGIRVALGAVRSDIAGAVMWQGGRLVIIGVAAGIAGSVAVASVLGTLLYGISGTDVPTMAAVAGALAIMAAAAAALPCWRATRVDPWLALREE